MTTRRTILQAIAALPFAGWLKPTVAAPTDATLTLIGGGRGLEGQDTYWDGLHERGPMPEVPWDGPGLRVTIPDDFHWSGVPGDGWLPDETLQSDQEDI